MELVDLVLHERHVGLPGEELPVRERPLRSGDLVDEVANHRRLVAGEVAAVQRLVHRARDDRLLLAGR
jgi:hypothetical protein